MTSVIIGGLIGFAGGIIAGLLPVFLQNRRERRGLACSLAGEISAIVESLEKRQYEQSLEQLIQKINTTNDPGHYTVRLEQNYFVVYEANAAKIGLLPQHAAQEVARFYTFAKSLFEDATDKNFDPKKPEDAIRRLNEMLFFLRLLIQIGKSVEIELKAV